MDEHKKEFWEAAFTDKQDMWGHEPARSAMVAKDLFAEHAVKRVLVPGIGYGRNAQLFTDNGMEVTGIEISQTAIDIAKQHYGTEMNIYHGSVTDMPFDNQMYDGIFCHALIHLLDSEERAKLIRDCYDQLAYNGLMVFTAISTDASSYGMGKLIDENRYEQHGGVNIYFYDRAAVHNEFANAGLYEVTTIEENHTLFLIKCMKGG